MTCSRALITIVSVVVLSGFLHADVDIWSTNGPYNCRVQAIAIHPFNSQHIYIGTVENGMYQTFNGGEEWHHIDSDLMPNIIRKIVIHPYGPDTLFTATTKSIYKSIDGGNSWERIYFPTGWQYEIRALAIHPSSPNIVYVSGPPFTGINYRSLDGGQTWDEMSLTQISATNFVIDPVDDNIIYATSHTRTFRRSLFRSNDLGDSWTNIHNNLDTTMTVYGFAIDPTDNQTMYICGNDWTNTGRCVFKTENSGESWYNISPDSLVSNWVVSITISPFDHNNLFICTEANGVLRSTDGGDTWQEINNGLVGRMEKIIVCDENSAAIYLGTYYNGIYRSNSNGDLWEKISDNISSTECTDFAIIPTNPSGQFACMIGGIYKSTDYGQSWNFIDILYPDYNRWVTCIAIDSMQPLNIFVGISSLYSFSPVTGIARSADEGSSWEFFNTGLPNYLEFSKIRIGHYDGSSRIFTSTTNGLYVSDSYGESWNFVNGIPGDFLFALDINPANNDYIYTGMYQLYGSADGGYLWDQLNVPPNNGFINEIKCHPYNPEEIYICIYGSGVYRSYNAGDTWENITNNLPMGNFIWISGLAINPLNINNMFINSHHYGIFQTHDAGQTWEAFNDSLNTLYNNGITVIDPQDTNTIYLATNQQSVWSITRTPVTVDDNTADLPSQFNITAYPNPFNAAANIRFSLPKPSAVRLDIYDLLGRKAESLLDTYLPAGNHSILWHPEELSAGIYIYKINTDYYQTSKKITLLK